MALMVCALWVLFETVVILRRGSQFQPTYTKLCSGPQMGLDAFGGGVPETEGVDCLACGCLTTYSARTRDLRAHLACERYTNLFLSLERQFLIRFSSVISLLWTARRRTQPQPVRLIHIAGRPGDQPWWRGVQGCSLPAGPRSRAPARW